MCGMLVVAIILVVPCIMPFSWLILELGDGVSVELLGLQPTRANAARTVIAASGMTDFGFIGHLFDFTVHVSGHQRDGKSMLAASELNQAKADVVLR
jgi:hypothetical protein